ncbi:MAG: hypothetical protein Q4D38_10845 [Planctomycetia bacterium]|nr:hypothetical protein [Planctomycetia bacterium]
MFSLIFDLEKNRFSPSFFALLLTSVLFVGCNSSKDETPDGMKDAPVPAAEDTKVADVSSVPTAQPGVEMRELYLKPAEIETATQNFIQSLAALPELVGVDEPTKITYYFIKALQAKNESAVLGLLTEEAFTEISENKISLCQTNAMPTAEVKMGEVQYLEDEAGEIVGARVGTIWTVASPDGDFDEHIGWALRKEDDQWLVAGMFSVINPQFPPILINFEDMEETRRKMDEVEAQISETLGSASNDAAGAKTQVETLDAQDTLDAQNTLDANEALPGLLESNPLESNSLDPTSAQP